MRNAFDAILTEAVAEFTEHGYDSQDRLNYWLAQLRESALGTMIPQAQMQQQLAGAMRSIYEAAFSDAALKRMHGAKFQRGTLSPKYRTMLDQRIMASADLIKLNRTNAIETTLSRFAGWASSQPDGGSRIVKRNEVKDHVAKPMRKMKYEERRCLTDQGHKMTAAINRSIADDQGAIAMEWHSHWRQAAYDYREDHKERDGKIYLLRGSWAHEAGLVKPGPVGYSDEITQPAEEVYCRCAGRYLYALRRLPDDMLTEKGREMLTGANKSATKDAA